jgi:8-oxo-dGTP diphosphatase
MWDGRGFSGSKLAVIAGDRTIIYKRDNIPTIPFPGLWDLPGGGREGCESPLDCALRETHEEFGLHIDATRVCFYRAYPDHRFPMEYSYFLVAEVEESTFSNVRFGDEGERWEVATLHDFLQRQDAVPHLQARLREWLEVRGSEGSSDGRLEPEG